MPPQFCLEDLSNLSPWCCFCNFCCCLETPDKIFLYLAILYEKDRPAILDRPETGTIAKGMVKMSNIFTFWFFILILNFLKKFKVLCCLFFRRRLVCAQAGLFSDKPVSKNAGTTFCVLCLKGGFMSPKWFGRRLTKHCSGFFHKINCALANRKKGFYIQVVCRRIRWLEEFLY